jgi:hypothetical protein
VDNPIPDVELELFIATVDVAVSRANRGDVAGGHDELLYGLQRAEAALDDGEAWAAELVEQWGSGGEHWCTGR